MDGSHSLVLSEVEYLGLVLPLARAWQAPQGFTLDEIEQSIGKQGGQIQLLVNYLDCRLPFGFAYPRPDPTKRRIQLPNKFSQLADVHVIEIAPTRASETSVAFSSAPA
jgi:hypothetical protein